MTAIYEDFRLTADENVCIHRKHPRVEINRNDDTWA